MAGEPAGRPPRGVTVCAALGAAGPARGAVAPRLLTHIPHCAGVLITFLRERVAQWLGVARDLRVALLRLDLDRFEDGEDLVATLLNDRGPRRGAMAGLPPHPGETA